MVLRSAGWQGLSLSRLRWSSARVVLAGERSVDLDAVNTEQRFDLSIGVREDRPHRAVLGSLREQQVDDARSDVGEEELDPLGRRAQDVDGRWRVAVGRISVARDHR